MTWSATNTFCRCEDLQPSKFQCQSQSNIHGNHVLVHCHAEFDNPDLSCVHINWLWREGLSVGLCPTSEKSGLCWVSAYDTCLWFQRFWVQYLGRSFYICEQIFLLKPSPLPELNFRNVKNTTSIHGWEGMLRLKSHLLTTIPGSPCLLG
jgi:hypothetical protein